LESEKGEIGHIIFSVIIKSSEYYSKRTELMELINKTIELVKKN
jgi:hypothetical protein